MWAQVVTRASWAWAGHAFVSTGRAGGGQGNSALGAWVPVMAKSVSGK